MHPPAVMKPKFSCHGGFSQRRTGKQQPAHHNMTTASQDGFVELKVSRDYGKCSLQVMRVESQPQGRYLVLTK